MNKGQREHLLRVLTERGRDREEFLDYTCRKAILNVTNDISDHAGL